MLKDKSLFGYYNPEKLEQLGCELAVSIYSNIAKFRFAFLKLHFLF